MPPSTLFKYIAIRILVGIGGIFCIFSGLILLIDLIENLRFASKVPDGGFGLAIQLTFLRWGALAQIFLPFTFLFGSIWMFHQLNRRSEISVMRSSGLSVWRMIGPATLIAAITGLLAVLVFDPIAANLMSQSEILMAKKQGREQSSIRVFTDGIWLRQRDEEMQLIINAQTFDSDSSSLSNITVWRFGPESVFYERIDADKAVLTDKKIELHDVRLKSISEKEQRFSPIYSIPTALAADDLSTRVTPPETLSIWQLPRFILLAETAGLPTTRYNIRFHDLCSTPLKLLAMVLIAASFSLRPVRMGGGLYLFLMTLAAGFALYMLSQIASALGQSGLVPVALAAWSPAIIATLAAATMLLYHEDG